MQRAFVASSDVDHFVELLEAQHFEAIPLTSDSIFDNIQSLETCVMILVDDKTPQWVLNEAKSRRKMIIAMMTVPPDVYVTAMITSEQEFHDLLEIIKPFNQSLIPIGDDFILCLARVKAMYPVRLKDRVIYSNTCRHCGGSTIGVHVCSEEAYN
jgi:hypothetical protein